MKEKKKNSLIRKSRLASRRKIFPIGAHSQFVDIGVKDAVYKSDARRFVRVRIGQFDMHLP